MSQACESHHYACACREHGITVLVKTTLDLASELDALKTVAPISEEERDRIQGVVERGYTACEDVGVMADEATGGSEHEEETHS